MSHNYFIHSSTDGHLGCFHILAIVNNAKMNIGVPIFFWISVLGYFGYIPKTGIFGPKADTCLIFWGISILLSTVAAPICIPTNSAKDSPFTTSSPALVVCWFIDDGHSDRCEMVSHCGFNLHFSDDEWCWASLHMSVDHLFVLWRSVSSCPLPPF